MSKKTKELLPAGIALILILSIFAVVVSIMNQKTIPAQSSPDTTPITNENQSPEEETDEEENTEIDEPQPYYTEYPKQSETSELFLFEQNISGYGDIIIKNLHQTTNNSYAIIETNSTFGDISVDKQSLAIAKLSVAGDIEKILTLPSRLALSYIDSKITYDGIAVMGKTDENILVYTVGYDLNSSEKETLPHAERGRLFLTSNNFIILTEGVQNTVYINDNENMRTGFLPSGEIVTIYDFHFYLMIFINTDTGYEIIKLSQNLQVVQTTTINNSSIIAITPYNDNGEQMYLVAEENNDTIRLWKYDNSFNKQNSDYTEMGSTNDLLLKPYNDKILAIYTGSSKGFYEIDAKTLEIRLISNIQNVNEIYDYILHDNGCYIFAKTYNGLEIIDYRYDKSQSSTIIDESAESAFFIKNLNNTISAFYNTTDDYDNKYIKIIVKNS